MKDKTKYTFGFTDYQGNFMATMTELEQTRYSRKYDWSEAIAAIGLGLSVSMIVAPMAWVELFKWMLS